ncbi:sugar-binding protein [Actinopolymorpha alba]|uniref:sugar-binding protein n=1 Tax=Actinopolymorpha alba TaxID=533267 RepID=UPI00036053A9|nr:sugar-binding protein [Actinopolymorpha alba]
MAHQRARSRAGRLFLVAALLAGLGLLTGPQAVQAETVLTVEGESPTSSNFIPGLTTDARATGGAFWRLFTQTEAPAGGYVATYTFDIPAAGLYQLDADTTPTTVDWTSPYKIKVNDKEPFQANAVSYGTVTPEIQRNHLATLTLPAGTTTISFLVDQRRISPTTAYTLFIDQIRLTPTALAVKGLDAEAPLNVFQASEEVNLNIMFNSETVEDTTVTYMVTDYWNTTVAQGSAVAPAGTSAAPVSLGQLPKGHYRLAARLGDDAPVPGEFAVVTDLADRPQLADSPFAVDVAAAWLTPPELYDELARGLRLAGFSWIRERARWNDTVNPAPGVFDFSSESRGKSFLAKAHEQRLKVLNVFHSSPTWTRDADDALPTDLMAAYEFAKVSADHYGDKVTAWEIWNESDHIGFSPAHEAADQYAAFLKAMSIGYLDSARKPLLSNVGHAFPRGTYADLAAANQVLDYVDIHSWHRYAAPDDSRPITPVAPGTEGHVSLVDEYGSTATRRWMTESGMPLQSSPPQLLTPFQQQQQARYFTTATLLNLAKGADKHFGFVVPPYNESTNYFGLLTRSYTPNVAYTSEAAMTAALGAGDYAGPVPGLPAGVTGLAFNDGDDQVIALWSEQETPVRLTLGVPSVTRTDIVGETSELASGTGTYALTSGPDLVYLRLPDRKVVTTAPTVRRTESVNSAVELTPAERVVVAQRYPAATAADAKASGYLLPLDAPTTVPVDLYNFNATAMTGTVSAVATGGWLTRVAAQQVMIPAMSKVTVDVMVSAGPDTVLGAPSRVTVDAVFGGAHTSVSQAMIRSTQTALSARHVLTADGKHAVRATYVNETDSQRQLTGASAVFDGAVKASTMQKKVVQPGESASLDVVVPKKAASVGKHSYQVRLSFADGTARPIGGSLIIPDPAALVTAGEVAAIDPARPTITFPEDADLGGKVWLAWSAEALVLRADLTDDVHVQPYTGTGIWQADSIQLAVAPGLPGETTAAGAEYGLAATRSGSEVFRWRSMNGQTGATAAQASVSRDEDAKVTHYELRIPWSELTPASPDQRLLSVSVLLNDDDGAGRRFLEWGSGIAGTKDSSTFKPVQLGSR